MITQNSPVLVFIDLMSHVISAIYTWVYHSHRSRTGLRIFSQTKRGSFVVVVLSFVFRTIGFSFLRTWWKSRIFGHINIKMLCFLPQHAHLLWFLHVVPVSCFVLKWMGLEWALCHQKLTSGWSRGWLWSTLQIYRNFVNKRSCLKGTDFEKKNYRTFRAVWLETRESVCQNNATSVTFWGDFTKHSRNLRR